MTGGVVDLHWADASGAAANPARIATPLSRAILRTRRWLGVPIFSPKSTSRLRNLSDDATLKLLWNL